MNKLRFVRIVGFGIIGILLGFSLLIVDDIYFQPWHEISTLPNQTIELYPGSTVKVFSPESWAVHPEYRSTKPCDYSSPEFSLFNNHPKIIQDCIQVTYLYGAEYLIDFTYILDSNGSVWKWSSDPDSQERDRKGTYFIVSGFIIGVAIAILLNRRTRH